MNPHEACRLCAATDGRKLKCTSGGLLTMANLPNPASIDWRAMLGAITVIVVGIIMLVVGLGGASVGGGVVKYILSTLNNSNVVIPSSYNYLNQANPNIGSASALAGVVLIVVAAVAIIVALFIAFRPFFGGTT